MKIDRTLIEKYNQAVPRYTSYPPANFFTNQVDNDSFLEIVKKSNQKEPKNISIYIHIPFCNSLCFYCGCNSIPMSTTTAVEEYLSALKKEMALVLPLLDKNRVVTQLHYGGGTPNAIPATWLIELNSFLFNQLNFAPSAEIAIECHPASLTHDYIKGLHVAGFNRFSLGIQDFNLQVLKAVNRQPSKMPLHELITALRAGKNVAVNLDFIYGLPHQTKESFLNTMHQALEHKPDRLVTFSYAHVPWVNKAQLKLEAAGLPSGKEKIDMTEAAYNLLSENGYKPIGMDHYVLETDELFKAQQKGNLHRNFQGYCTRETTGQVYAFGVSAISQLSHFYAQNTKHLPTYISKLNNQIIPLEKTYQLNEKELIIREIINQFMCNKTINWQEVSTQLGIHKSNLFECIVYDQDKLVEFQQEGIIEFDTEMVSMKENGLAFLRNVAASFDPLMTKNEKTFSKAI